jgi:hypothetical protein
LHLAAACGHIGILSSLLQVCGTGNILDDRGYTPLHWACYNGMLPIFTYICTIQYSTVQYSTVQYSTVQYSTVIFICIHFFINYLHKYLGGLIIIKDTITIGLKTPGTRGSLPYNVG